MKTYLKIGIPVIVVLILLVAVPFLLPLETYRGPIQRAASNALGRVVKIAGPMHLTLYPDIGVSLSDVSVSNAPGAREPLMASVGSAVVGVKLMPLLSGKIEVERVILQQPVIHLEVAKDGTPNWAFADAKAQNGGRGGGGSMPGNIGIWDIAIDGGQVSYSDARTDASHVISDAAIRLQILQGEVNGLNAPLTVTGKLTYNCIQLTLDGVVDSPAAVLKGNGTHAHINISSPAMNVDFDGTFANSGRVAGNVKMGAPSLRKFAAWAGHPLPPGNGFGLIALESNLTMDDGKIMLSGAQIAVDSMHISGDLSLDTQKDVPTVKAVIAIDRLDVNPYLAPGTEDDTVKAGRVGKAASDDAPLALGGLKAVEADMTLNLGALVVENIKIEHTMVSVGLHKGVLTADLKNMTLYGGGGKGTLTVDASNDVPRIHSIMAVDGIKALPFLKDLVGIDRIEGTGAVQFDVTSQGASERAIVAASAGKGSVKFTNGAVHGADLGAIARVLQTVLTGEIVLGNAVGENARTTFGQAGGTFTINKGIVHTTDMKLTNPTVEIAATGDVNIAAQTLDFHVEPKAGKRGNLPGVSMIDIGVPFNVKGPWTHPSYSPDVGGLAKGVVKGLANAPANILKQPGKALQSLFGGGK